MKTEVIVVAAGTGKRLKAGTVKALVPLKGEPLLVYSLKVFNAHPAIDGIVLVGVKDCLKDFGRVAKRFKKVRAVVAGGARRSDSVKCGLKEILKNTNIVLVHDAARPFVEDAMINHLLEALKKNKAATIGVPVKFTVKKVDRKTLTIKGTLVRDLLWETQTPQGFHRDVLVKAHARKFKEEATDDAMMVERMGGKVKMVMGDYANIKVTTPDDIIIAEHIL